MYELITASDIKTVPTPNAAVDVGGALIRGLAEHIRRVSWNHGQRDYQFTSVTEYLSGFESVSDYPAACCYPDGEGQFDDQGTLGNDVEDYGTFALMYWGDFTQTIKLECYFTTHQNRQAALMALDAACVPVEWMRGFRIVLTDYYNAVGEYSAVNRSIEDNADDLTKGWYKVSYTYQSKAPLFRGITLPRMHASAETTTGVAT